jgi:hypothetical protein
MIYKIVGKFAIFDVIEKNINMKFRIVCRGRFCGSLLQTRRHRIILLICVLVAIIGILATLRAIRLNCGEKPDQNPSKEETNRCTSKIVF